MSFSLPESVKSSLAERSMRLHHLLWHTIRNNWHAFTTDQKATFQQNHPSWVPMRSRFIRLGPGVAKMNINAGESFLYMHRQMLLNVNARLAELGEPPIVPWDNIPSPDDTEYPVPGRGSTRLKEDSFYLDDLLPRVKDLLDPVKLRSRSLAHTGALLESAIHDPMHGRWAEVSAGQMQNFPVLDPTIIAPTIASIFDPPEVDWLGHPYSSHVNSVFWKLHGFCDQIIEQWRIANNLTDITWTDTWVGGSQTHESMADTSSIISGEHHHHEHVHHPNNELMDVFKTLNTFKDCHIGFDYLEKNKIRLPKLK